MWKKNLFFAARFFVSKSLMVCDPLLTSGDPETIQEFGSAILRDVGDDSYSEATVVTSDQELNIFFDSFFTGRKNTQC